MIIIDCTTGQPLTNEQIAALPAEITPTAEQRRAAIPAITSRQARRALLAAGKLANVDTALAALPLPQREAAQIDWQHALTFERNHPLITTMGAALGLTDAQIDDLFALGRTFV